MNLAVFFHVYAAGNWREPLSEFIQALDGTTPYPGPIRVGLVGTADERDEVERYLTTWRDYEVVAAEDEGYEQLTLTEVARYARENDGAVLYAHTKGAARAYGIQRAWRRETTREVVAPWKANLEYLRTHDVLGSSWQYEWKGGFAANFWIARCDYLRTLPLFERRRTSAETWIAKGIPRIWDLAPLRLRLIPCDRERDDAEDGNVKIYVPPDSTAVLVSEDGANVIAIQIIPTAWFPEPPDEKPAWRILTPAESKAWRESYAAV